MRMPYVARWHENPCKLKVFCAYLTRSGKVRLEINQIIASVDSECSSCTIASEESNFLFFYSIYFLDFVDVI